MNKLILACLTILNQYQRYNSCQLSAAELPRVGIEIDTGVAECSGYTATRNAGFRFQPFPLSPDYNAQPWLMSSTAPYVRP